MALGKDYTAQDCALARALELVGERWTLLVVRDAFYGVRRFSDFQAHLDIPRAVLTSRLTSLVEAGVFERRRYTESPPRDEYVLTDTGRALWPAVFALARWAQDHLSAASGPLREFVHITCGSTVDAAGVCPACREHIPPTALEMHPGPGLSELRRTDHVSLALRKPHRLLEPLFPEEVRS